MVDFALHCAPSDLSADSRRSCQPSCRLDTAKRFWHPGSDFSSRCYGHYTRHVDLFVHVRSFSPAPEVFLAAVLFLDGLLRDESVLFFRVQKTGGPCAGRLTINPV